jgi:predicted MFS family arabinose efflux permease
VRLPLGLIVAATVLAHSAFNGSRLNISLQALAFGASPMQVGVMMSLFAALPMLLAVTAGRFVDRVGVRGPLLVATGALPLAIALPAAFPAMGLFYGAAAAIGGAFTLFHICVQHAVGEGSSAEARRANFGWLALGFSISNFLGPTTAGLAIDMLGHRAAFCVSAMLAVAGFVLVLARRHLFSHTPAARPSTERRSAVELLRNAGLRRVFIVTGLLASAWDLFVFVMPIYGTSIGLSASTIGLILGSFALATFVVRLALPWLSRHLRDWMMITATMVIACMAYALFPLVSTVPLLAMTAFLLGLGLGATQPSIMSLLYSTAPEGRAAEAVGVRSVVLNASTTVLPIAFGALGAALGMAPVFWSMALALAGGGVFANRHRRLSR